MCFFLSDFTSTISPREVGQQSLFDFQRTKNSFDEAPKLQHSTELAIECSTLVAFTSDTAKIALVTIGNPKSAMLGGGEGIRTPDPMVANHVLCQLSYTPDKQLPRSDTAISNLVAGAGFEPATFGL